MCRFTFTGILVVVVGFAFVCEGKKFLTTISDESRVSYKRKLQNIRSQNEDLIAVRKLAFGKKIKSKINRDLKKLFITGKMKKIIEKFGKGRVLAFYVYRLKEWYKGLGKRVGRRRQLNCNLPKPKLMKQKVRSHQDQSCDPEAVTDDCLQDLQIGANTLLQAILNTTEETYDTKVENLLKDFKEFEEKTTKKKKRKKRLRRKKVKLYSICGVFGSRIYDVLDQFS